MPKVSTLRFHLAVPCFSANQSVAPKPQEMEGKTMLGVILAEGLPTPAAKVSTRLFPSLLSRQQRLCALFPLADPIVHSLVLLRRYAGATGRLRGHCECQALGRGEKGDGSLSIQRTSR
ncbi:unnamed protein product, partial [Phaeothamnion confervicola]